jgi:hypothetical protein
LNDSPAEQYLSAFAEYHGLARGDPFSHKKIKASFEKVVTGQLYVKTF